MYYVGLDVSVKRTAVCIVNAAGKRMHEAAVNSTPQAVGAAIKTAGVQIERVGLEAGVTSAWLARGLLAMGLPVIVIDATHAAAALKTGFRNKTDRNDARGIADLMRVNKFRPVWVKSPAAQRDRALLTVREQLRRQSLDARNTIWSILQAEGFQPPRIASPAFEALLGEMLDEPRYRTPTAAAGDNRGSNRSTSRRTRPDHRRSCQGQRCLSPVDDRAGSGAADCLDLPHRGGRARAIPQCPNPRRSLRPDTPAFPIRRNGLVRPHQPRR